MTGIQKAKLSTTSLQRLKVNHQEEGEELLLPDVGFLAIHSIRCLHVRLPQRL
jgi:hypothetical protein